MNRLELRYTPVTRGQESQVLHGVVPYIDGVSLIEIVDDIGYRQTGPLLSWAFPQPSRGGADLIEILDCECTDHGCGGVDVHVSRSDEIVSWHDFLGSNETRLELPSFEFEAAQYDSEVASLNDHLWRVVPWAKRAHGAAVDGMRKQPSHHRRLIGIAGAPGSGKSTLAHALRQEFGSDLRAETAVLSMDGFHLPQAELVRLGRRDRMGAPDTFDVDGFVSTLEELRVAGSTVHAPAFDRSIEEPVPDAIEIGADIRVVIVEGNYLLHDRDGWERVRPLLDTVIFLAPDDAVRRERLIARHVTFGKTPAEAEEWVARSDDPNAALVAATASRADHILR